MKIELYIKTSYKNRAIELIQSLLSSMPYEYIKNTTYIILPYSLSCDILLGEIELILNCELDDDITDTILNSISNKWVFYKDKSEAVSSEIMDDCEMKYSIEMANVYF